MPNVQSGKTKWQSCVQARRAEHSKLGNAWANLLGNGRRPSQKANVREKLAPHSGMVWGSQYGQKQVKCCCQAPNLLVTTRKLEGLNLFVFQPRPAGHPCGFATSAIGGPRKFLLERVSKKAWHLLLVGRSERQDAMWPELMCPYLGRRSVKSLNACI